MEFYLSHQHTQSHLSHVGQVGQSYGILSVPSTHSILCVRLISPVPCGTSGTILWNHICPTNTLNQMCPSYPTCTMYDKWDSPMESYMSHHHTQSYVSVLSHLSHVGQVGESHGILPIPPIHPILSHLYHVGQVGQLILWNPTHPTNTLNPMSVLSYLSH